MKRFFIILLCVCASAFSAGAHALPEDVKVGKPHPYLFADETAFAELASSDDPYKVILRNLVFEMADNALAESDPECPDHWIRLHYMRSVESRILSLAMAFRLSGKAEYKNAAISQMLKVCTDSDWGLSHFLDVGEGCTGVAVGYDWLYDELTPDQRTTIRTAIMERALLPSLEVNESNASWFKGDFNWNQVCHGGLTVGALAILDEEEDVPELVIRRALECIPYAGAAYYPDGAYAEGPSYWEFGTSYHVIMIEALRTALGSSFGIEEFPGFLGTADYKVQMRGSTGLEFNYSDYHIDRDNQPVLSWFASELSRPELQEHEAYVLRTLAEGGKGRYVASRLTPFELIWWKTGKPACKSSKGLQVWSATGGVPIVTMRTDSRHGNAYLAFKGGTANQSHGHQDVGGFVYEYDGIRWALDQGTENYDKMRAASLDLWNYTQNSSRWTTFRPGPDAHNILRVDGAHLITEAKVTDLKVESDRRNAAAEMDITPLYSASKIHRAVRRMTMDSDGNIVLEDMVHAAGNDIRIISQWLTDAEVAKESTGMLLTKDGKAIHVVVPPSIEVKVVDVSSPEGIQNSENPGLKRLEFSRIVKAGETGTLRISAGAF